MKRFVPFPKIKNLRDVYKDIEHLTRYVGKDENNNLIYNNKPLPIITAIGTEKIHGTNAAVAYNNIAGFWVQKRTSIITPQNDNAKCAMIAEKNKEIWMEIIKFLAKENKIDLNKNTIIIYYEHAGKNIQKGSAVSGTADYISFIFTHFLVTDLNRENDKWYKMNYPINIGNIYKIEDFGKYFIDIDFNNIKYSFEKINELVNYIENNSSVAKYFGKPENPGEGIVWEFWYKNILFRFKTKGEKHNKHIKQPKQLTTEEFEETNKIINFVNKYAIKAERLEQIWQKVFGINNEKQNPNMKHIGEFLKEYIKDVWDEEMNIAIEQGINIKKTNKFINKSVKNWFIEKLENEIYKNDKI